MVRRALLGLIALILADATWVGTAWADGQTAVDLALPRGASERYLLITPSGPARAVVLLLSGGGGVVGIPADGNMKRGRNFLVRSRDRFLAHDLVVAVLDAPTDYQGADGLGNYRITAGQAEDVGAAIADLRRRFGLPVWVIGTSMGTISAANAAARLPTAAGPDGLVLTSSVSREAGRNRGALRGSLQNVDLPRIHVPTLIVVHQDDACAVSPPGDAPAIAADLTKAPIVAQRRISGGRPAESSACDAYAPHGYFGVEQETVDVIAGWLLNPSP